MQLVKFDLKDKILNESRIKDLTGNIYSIRRFYSKKFNKEYSVFKIESEKRNIILKKTSSHNEIAALTLLDKLKLSYIPEIFFIKKHKEYSWIVMEYIEQKKMQYTLDNILDLTHKLAHFHIKTFIRKDSVRLPKTFNYYSQELNSKFIDKDISKQYLHIIKKALKVLQNSTQTIIHGDMIPLNVLFTSNGIKIIDFEHLAIGSYIVDLARLLGDYNINKPWIPSEWEDIILNTYYAELLNSAFHTSLKQMKIEFNCAKLYNYLTVIAAFKRNNWKKTDWYYLNITEITKSINSLVQHF